MVLAIHTAQITSAEKNSAGSGFTADAGLLPKMQGSPGQLHPIRHMTIANLPQMAVGATISWAEPTRLSHWFHHFHKSSSLSYI